MHTHQNSQACTRMYSHTRAHTHTHTHTHTHKISQACTQTHTLTHAAHLGQDAFQDLAHRLDLVHRWQGHQELEVAAAELQRGVNL
jgi:hypothetical protein